MYTVHLILECRAFSCFLTRFSLRGEFVARIPPHLLSGSSIQFLCTALPAHHVPAAHPGKIKFAPSMERSLCRLSMAEASKMSCCHGRTASGGFPQRFPGRGRANSGRGTRMCVSCVSLICIELHQIMLNCVTLRGDMLNCGVFYFLSVWWSPADPSNPFRRW